MLVQLVSEVEGQLDQVASAISRSDHQALADAAHRITNSGRMFGADELTEAASLLEELAGDGEGRDAAHVTRAAQALFARWEETRAALDDQVGRGAARSLSRPF